MSRARRYLMTRLSPEAMTRLEQNYRDIERKTYRDAWITVGFINALVGSVLVFLYFQ